MLQSIGMLAASDVNSNSVTINRESTGATYDGGGEDW